MKKRLNLKDVIQRIKYNDLILVECINNTAAPELIIGNWYYTTRVKNTKNQLQNPFI